MLLVHAPGAASDPVLTPWARVVRRGVGEFRRTPSTCLNPCVTLCNPLHYEARRVRLAASRMVAHSDFDLSWITRRTVPACSPGRAEVNRLALGVALTRRPLQCGAVQASEPAISAHHQACPRSVGE